MKRHLGFAAAVVVLLCGATLAGTNGAEFTSNWRSAPDRVWIGPEYWANRLQDWRIASGRLECVESRPRYALRTVHLLTHQLAAREGELAAEVRTGVLNPSETISPDAAAGLVLGIGHGKLDYRSASLVHQSRGPGAGILVGVNGRGEPMIVDNEIRPAAQGKMSLEPIATNPVLHDVVVRVLLSPSLTRARHSSLRVSLHEPGTDRRLGWVQQDFPTERLAGNVALVSHPGSGAGATSFWFDALQIRGNRCTAHPDRTLGPVATVQYTLSRDVLKLTAQMMPLGKTQSQRAALHIGRDGQFEKVAEADIIVPGWTATFRVPDWDSTRDTPYRVVYEGARFEGTVGRDPVDKPTIVVAGFTGNHNNHHGLERGYFDWMNGVWFPHQDLTSRVLRHEPDVLFFSGDQVYEGASPTHPDVGNIKLDYLYKWYLWCWAYRDLTRNIPTVTIPDDHDVYQGNLWGEGGRKTDKDDKGGYVHPADFVKMSERTQTSHLPDPFDPTPVEQGIGVYYTDMVYGRISFAVLEDRKFKSGCNGRVPHAGSARADHIVDPDFDVRRADVPGVKLLGDRQLKFLKHWAKDWRGADMKVALSQTVFANVATHHGGGLSYLRADLDSNGWPQSGRNRAIDALRRGFAFHLAGDQHLATIVHHGIDDWGDACWTFTVPSIANFYPRAWSPKNQRAYVPPDPDDYTGNFHDGLGNLVTVYAATNPGKSMGHEPKDLHDNMPGYGILRLDKEQRSIAMECWPRYADPQNPADHQYQGWPKTISQLDNYGRKPVAYLPEIRVTGLDNPVVQVLSESDPDPIYTLRIRGRQFRPKVFAQGRYTVRVGEPDRDVWKTLEGLDALPRDETRTVEVRFP